MYACLATNAKRKPFTSHREEKTQRECSITDSLYPKGPEVDMTSRMGDVSFTVHFALMCLRNKQLLNKQNNIKISRWFRDFI